MGLLASIAIPVFLAYMQQVKTAEAHLLISEIANDEIAFFQRPRLSADGTQVLEPCFVGAGPSVFPPKPYSQPWVDDGKFSAIGFAPAGNVYFSY